MRTGRDPAPRAGRPPSSMRVRRGPLMRRGGSRVGIIGTDDASIPWVLPTR